MERPVQVSLAFLDEKPVEQVSLGQMVITGLAEKADTFPNPPVPLETLTETNQALSGAEQAARSGDHAAVENLPIVQKLWQKNFRKTALYVNLVADGDASVIREANLVPTKGETTPS